MNNPRLALIFFLGAPAACFVGSKSDLGPEWAFDGSFMDDGGDSGAMKDGGLDTSHDAHTYVAKAKHCERNADAAVATYTAPGGNDDDAGIYGGAWSMPQVVSFGGPVTKHPIVIPISFLEDDQDTIDEVEDFCASVLCTPYWEAIAKDYGVGPGSATPGVRLPEKAWKAIDDKGIANWLKAKLDNKDPAFPPPTADSIYSLYLPYSTDVTLQGLRSCQQFGAYHNSTRLSNNMRVAYAVMPRCSGFDELTNASTHEFIEAATDPFPQSVPTYGQTDPAHLVFSLISGGEVADLCQFNMDARYQPQGFPWVVQRSWSNSEAFLGRDPCAPASSAPWIVGIPDQPDVIHYYNYAMKGIKMQPQETRTIPLRLHSKGSQNWAITVRDINVFQGGPARLQFSINAGSGKDGDVIDLKITKLSNNNNGIEIFFVTSSGNGKTSYYWSATASQ